MAKTAQNTSDENTWPLVAAQEDLKACMEEISSLKEKLVKKNSNSKETLTPQMKKARREAELAENQLVHVEAEKKDLCGFCEELKAAMRRLAGNEVKIAPSRNCYSRKELQSGSSCMRSSWPPKVVDLMIVEGNIVIAASIARSCATSQ